MTAEGKSLYSLSAATQQFSNPFPVREQRSVNYQLGSLTNRQKEAIVPGESQTLHRPRMVSDGNTAFFVEKIPYADEAPAAVATASCRHNCLDTWRDVK